MATAKRDDSYNPFGVDDGDYELVVTEVEEKASEKFDKKPFLIWSFQVIDPVRNGEYVADEVTLNGTTPSITQEGQKLDKWLKACGINLEDGEEFETDEVVGKHVKGIIEKVPNKKTGKEYSQVTKLIPLRSKPPSKEQSKTKPAHKKPSAAAVADTEAEDLVEEAIRQEAATKKATGKPAAKSEAKGATGEVATEEGSAKEDKELYAEFEEEGEGKNEDSDVPF